MYDNVEAKKCASRIMYMICSFNLGRHVADRGDRSYQYGKVTRQQCEDMFREGDS